MKKERLPRPETVGGWGSGEFVGALRHNRGCAAYNQDFRRLIHVGFKVAVELGARHLDALAANEAVIARNVTGNLFDRHLRPIFA